MRDLTAPEKMVASLLIIFGFVVMMILLTQDRRKDPRNDTVLMFQFEGCEYIKFKDNIIHKGNCTNTMHVYNKK